MKSIQICAFGFCYLVFFNLATASDLVRLSRIEGTIRVDGIVDEDEWQNVQPLPMVMYQPTYLGEMTEKTEIRIAYDQNYLYIAGRLYSQTAGEIRANSHYRDGYSGDDILAVVLDTFNDNENAMWFFTNPLGTRFDATISNDASGGRGSMNFNWNTFWDVATSRNQDGWFAEMRIPFSSLRFQGREGKVVMGLITYRFLAAKNERHIYPAIPPNWRLGMAKPSVAQDVIIEGVYSKNPVYITPYALGGLEQNSEINTAETGYHFDTNRSNELGVDIKYNLTDNLTLDGTINTDFAQVETDDQRLNLTRFSLFFPEKRQFFQERSGLFEFEFSGSSRLFHSRRIGLSDGTPVRILGGMRLVGRVGKWDMGFLDMQTANRDDLASENFGVLRLRKQVFNSYSNIGGMATSRLGKDGSVNLAYGIDGIIRLFGDEYLTVKWAQSFKKSTDDEFNPTKSGRAHFVWERRQNKGLNYDFVFSWSGSDFNPGMGFERRQNFTLLSNKVNYLWFLNQNSKIRSLSIENEWRTFLRNEDGAIETALITPSFALEMKTGATLRLSTDHNYDAVLDSFNVTDNTEILPGSYWFHAATLRLRSSRGRLFRPNFTLSVGGFYDGWKWTLRAGPSWTLSSHLELRGDYEYNRVRFNDRGQGFDAHIARLRVQTALNNHLSLKAFLQYSNVSDLVSINARLRYHFSEGNDLWFVYDEGVNTQRGQPATPRLPITDNRAILFKYTYTFIR